MKMKSKNYSVINQRMVSYYKIKQQSLLLNIEERIEINQPREIYCVFPSFVITSNWIVNNFPGINPSVFVRWK